jgi:O-antigen/teichoic acid export membrane protein
VTNQGLKSLTVKNISLNAVAKIIMFGLQAVANIILTRTLLPSDYGLVGMALIFMNFFILFGDLGISNAVIRKEELSERDVYTGFTVRIAQGIILVLLCAVASPVASWVFHNTEVGRILLVFSFVFLISTLGFIPHAYLNRELRYDRLFIPQVGNSLISAVVAIVMALAGFRHWSLVFATLSGSVASVILLNVMRPSKMRFCLDVVAARHFINYGMNIFLVGLFSYALLNAGNFFIGAKQGATALGYYTIAFNWGGMICTVIIGTVSNVLFPTFAKIQEDRKRLRLAYLKIIEFMAVIAILANLTLFLTGKEFLYFVLGHSSDKWFPSLAAFQILCVFGILKSLLEPGANLMMAIGDTAVPFRATLVAAVIQLSLIYPALHYWGIEGVAILIVLATSAQFFVYLPSLKRTLDLPFRELAGQVRPAVLAMLLTGAVVTISAPLLGPLSLVAFAVKLVLLLVLFLGSYGILTRWRIFREIMELVKGGNVIGTAGERR